MKYSVTTTLEKIQALEGLGKRTWVIQGGTSAGKTVAILIHIINYLLTHPRKTAWIVSDTLANLKDGALEDFNDIMAETNAVSRIDWNIAESTGRFKNGSVVKFRGVDKIRGHGPRRDLLYVNEANRIDWDTYRELAKRTRGQRIIDFNPVNEFWAHTELVNNPLRKKGVAFLKVNYLDNEALDQDTVNDIEEERGDGTNNWWRVYGLGEIGSLEGNVYEGWLKCSEIPTGSKLVRYGLDFGFSNDETGMVSIWESEDGRTIVREELYQKGILGSQYAEILKSHNIDPSVLIVADGARPEIIAEIQNAGYRIIAADKNAGSVKRGIDRVQQRKISYIGNNLEREFLTYAWRKKRTGEVLDEPQDGNDHLMDALRYAIDDLSRKVTEYGGVRC